MRVPARLMTVVAVTLVASTADAQLISTPNPSPGGIGTPFAGPTGAPGTNPGTIYQQIYNASSFATASTFNQIRFFQDGTGGEIRAGTYSVFLSTSTRDVTGPNGLTTAFDMNRGADNMLFGVFTLGGMAPATLELTGSAFLYDPSQGNLLLDIRVANGGPRPGQAAFFQGQNIFGGGDTFSSASNFTSPVGVVLNSQGLFTEFRSVRPNVVPEPATIALVAGGLALLGIGARRRNTTTNRS